MSTHWGYVCLSHDPPLESERWLSHGDDALIDLLRKVRSGEWPKAADLVPHLGLAYGDELASMEYVHGGRGGPGIAFPIAPRPGGGTPPWSGPPAWLQQHPRCQVALRNEYGNTRTVAGTVQGSVAPPAVER